MRNVFVEGIQGAGKSTLVGHLAKALPQLHVCREGDYSPVDLAWCAYMTQEQYEAVRDRFPSLKEEIARNTVREGDRVIVTYTKIHTDDRSVFETFEAYEIYNGRKTLRDLKEIVLSRYRRFQDSGYLFECAFFQNVVEDLILYHQLGDEEILSFYRELWKEVDKVHFLLVYLYSEKMEENINLIRKERCDSEGREVWYEMMMDYLRRCPYGKARGLNSFEDLTAHLAHRQQLELRIIRDVIGDAAVILPAKMWELDAVRARICGGVEEGCRA